MNGVYTVFILIVEDCSGILLQMHAMLSCITFLAQLHNFRGGLKKWDWEYSFSGENKQIYFSYDWILKTQDCDYISQHFQRDKRF